jgi:2-keto-4-pentenoate hydratase/2-oxohepta-3-ene-1,7-dioic acid hydratase in catechol pathway
VKVARYHLAGGVERCGVIDGDQIVELDGITFEDWLTRPPPPGTRAGQEAVRRPVAEVQLLPPIGVHAKIFCVGFNYATHSAEMDRDLPKEPTLFVRFPDTLVGHGAPVFRPAESPQFDWEGEVAIVIGASARRVPARAAMAHVAGFTAIADNSIRDWQFHSTQATAGKNWFASGACGPWLLTTGSTDGSDDTEKNGVPDGDALELRVRLNGEQVQSDTTAHLHFSCADLIAYISTFTRLNPGDVIATGTPSGIGYRRDPPVFLRAGDILEVEIEGLGVLSNPVHDEAPDTANEENLR